MKSKTEEATVLYAENREFINNKLSEPISQVEIRVNISSQLNIADPFSRARRFAAIMFAALLGLLPIVFSIPLLYILVKNFEIAIWYFVTFVVALGALLFGLYVLSTIRFLLQVPHDYVDRIYRNLVEQHTIKYAKVERIEHYFSDKIGIYYKLNDNYSRGSYITSRKWDVKAGDILTMLYLNDDTHVPL